ncbi:hypothetical protein D7S86_13425 [Pararobbsia silviterrae]|uniref:Uncharacterized protein n=1 Tax=Pararobbsia silviterrae TaxID=1792498 RepID=A0A494Y019_9BURK|nr:hypothetical protein D7S86_13425 [Pararobbsia silviterrae]
MHRGASTSGGGHEPRPYAGRRTDRCVRCRRASRRVRHEAPGWSNLYRLLQFISSAEACFGAIE